MNFATRLRSLFDLPEHRSDEPQRLTAAALLALVARADGHLGPEEEAELIALLRSRFALSEDDAADLVADAEALPSDLDTATDLTDRILRETPAAERPALLAMAYRVAASDGVVNEIEDNLVWRFGHLLGLGDREIDAIRQRALQAAA
jgi:uncharacterized tellurite resistance protein B-like protein